MSERRALSCSAIDAFTNHRIDAAALAALSLAPGASAEMASGNSGSGLEEVARKALQKISAQSNSLYPYVRSWACFAVASMHAAGSDQRAQQTLHPSQLLMNPSPPCTPANRRSWWR